MFDYVWLIPLFPAIGFLINGFFGKRYSKATVSWVACSALGLSFFTSILIFFELIGRPPAERLFEKVIFDWVVSGRFQTVIGYQIDPLSILMALVVTGVSFFIHIYSVGYMHDDPGFPRYFTYLNLFVFMMLNLILANNFLLMFVGWEGVGLCSYLLIGFWFEKDSAANAGKKAFVVNRVGDFGFLLGMFLLFTSLGKQGVWTLDFTEVFSNASKLDTATVTAITILFFVGATGKSAQIPLYVWLPDAMEGPTPVSSLIHAATMVTAGVYMIARCNVLYSMAPISLAIVAIVGVATAIYTASIGFCQNDIKKVLAYSTISQLGYMFLGVGVGAYSAGIFHLMTHAFFKGLLFLGAGSIMHALSGELDMRNMGGLRKKIPVTFWTFFIATLAIAGIPGLSGFFSKDEILWQAFSSSHGHFLLWLVAAVAAGMTAFYMFRALFMTFWGECRADEQVRHHIHESPKIMTVPLTVLAVASLIGGYVGVPHVLGGANHVHEFLAPVLGGGAQPGKAHAGITLLSQAWASGGEAGGHSAALEFMMMAVSVVIALIGIGIAYLFYVKNPALPKKLAENLRGLYKLVFNKYYIDELYEALFVDSLKGLGTGLWKGFDDFIIDGTINGIAYLIGWISGVVRRIQTGLVQNYAFSMIIGGVILVAYYIMRSIFF
ncbi:MAG: NADH-quinone oxidoreductase subunit L [Deltaproteobacteria bacterium RBG_16_48_10]|nr:MAG: NADH-quinone oxidoreductase subunit L [Deltaproteobacteria bacterium RBG_16_48_10]